MRHRKRRGKLKVSPSHNQAMRRNMIAALIEHGRITTTVAKAKAFRSYAEKLITMAVKGNRSKELGTAEGRAAHLHAIRRVASLLPHKPAVRKLFNEVAPAVGDRAPLALFELVDRESVGVAAAVEEEAGAES